MTFFTTQKKPLTICGTSHSYASHVQNYCRHLKHGQLKTFLSQLTLLLSLLDRQRKGKLSKKHFKSKTKKSTKTACQIFRGPFFAKAFSLPLSSRRVVDCVSPESSLLFSPILLQNIHTGSQWSAKFLGEFQQKPHRQQRQPGRFTRSLRKAAAPHSASTCSHI